MGAGKHWERIKTAVRSVLASRRKQIQLPWNNRCDQLAEWCGRAGSMPKQDSSSEFEASLAWWSHAQRRHWQAGTLTDVQKERLRAIPGMADRMRKWENPIKWKDRWIELQQWVGTRGHLPMRSAKEDEAEKLLAVWIKNQQTKLHEGKLSKARLELLRKIPIMAERVAQWENPRSWEDRYQELRKFAIMHQR